MRIKSEKTKRGRKEDGEEEEKEEGGGGWNGLRRRSDKLCYAINANSSVGPADCTAERCYALCRASAGPDG